MVRKLAGALIVASAFNMQNLNALGLGEFELKSALNQPLNAEIPLINIGDLSADQILVKLASPETFENAGVSRDFFLSNMKFTIELNQDTDSGTIFIKSRKLVREPYLNFLLETRWPSGRLVREYTALVDLPVFNDESAGVSVNLGMSPSASAANAAKDQMTDATPSDSVAVTATAAPAAKQVEPNFSQAGGQYKVKRNDTLWKIASRNKPSNDSSVQQTMVALQQLNPNAFYNNNINRIKAGATLQLPTLDDVRAIEARAAIAAVAKQNRSFNKPVASSRADASASGAAPKAADDSAGQLRLSSGGADNSATSSESSSAAEGELADTLARENGDLKSRVTDLNEKLETLERLLALKNDQLAQMQNTSADIADQEESSVEQAESVADDDNKVVAEAETTITDTTVIQNTVVVDEEGQVLAVETQLEETILTQSGDEVVEETIAVDVVSQADEPATPVVQQAPPQAQSFVASAINNPMVLGAGALIVVGLVAAALMRRRKTSDDDFFEDLQAPSAPPRAADADDVFDESIDAFDDLNLGGDSTADPVIEASDEIVMDIEEPVDEAPASTQSQTSDALAEADIYIAYGKHQQAAELLSNALSGEPERDDLRLKLLEVYVASGNQSAFQEQYAALAAAGNDNSIASAKELLLNVPNANGWMEGSAASDDVVAESDDLDFSFDLEDGTDAESTDEFDVDFGSVDLGTDAVASDASELLEDVGDFDLDLSGLDSAEPSDSVSLEGDGGLDTASDSDLTFDMGEGLDESFAELESNDEAVASDAEFDLGEDLAGGDLELGGDFDSIESEQDALADQALLDSDMAFESELETASDADLSLDAAPEVDQTVATEDANEDFLDAADEVATKLDLARAYIDMGDIDGAKEILDEVVAEGSDAQKQEAQELNQKIA